MTLKTYEFFVSATATATATFIVEAASEEEARAELDAELDERNSRLTSDLAQSASTRIRKEMGADEFTVELEGVTDSEDEEEAE